MNKSIEQYVESLTDKDEIRYPDFENMWNRIEAKRMKTSGNQISKRARTLTIAISAGAVLAITVPVVAQTVSWEWMKNISHTGVITAIERGFGQQIEKSALDNGVGLTVHTAVADENRLAINYSISLPEAPLFETAVFSHVELSSPNGERFIGNAVNGRDPANGRVVGGFVTNTPPKGDNQQLTFTAEDIELLRRSEKSITIDAQSALPQMISDIANEIPSITVTSIKREQDRLTIRYTLPLTKEQFSRLNPHLVIKSGVQSITSSFGTVLPSPIESQSEKQEVFLLSPSIGDDFQFHISYLEAAGRVEGKWTVPFKLETAIAKQNTYKKALTGQFADAGRSQHLAELVVTPSMIKVNTIAEGFDDNWKELFTYGKHQLQVGDQLIAGGMFAEGEGFSYRFEVPTSLKLTGEPVKMILSGVRIQKRGGKDHQVKLVSPSLAKQSVTTVMDGFEVRYTYYRDGNDLVVETSSDDANFGGIVQTVVLENGNKIDAYKREMQGPRWMSGNSSFERYAGLGEEDITIYPFTYSIYDPNAKLELPLIP